MTTKEDNAMSQARSGNIAVTVLPQAVGGWVCEVTTSLAGGVGPTECFHGQSASHAIAHALEDLARMFRKEAEAEQNVDWDAVERATSGEVINRRFHVMWLACVRSCGVKLSATGPHPETACFQTQPPTRRDGVGLTDSESQQLAALLRRYERHMLVRARAAALLRERGHDVTALLAP